MIRPMFRALAAAAGLCLLLNGVVLVGIDRVTLSEVGGRTVSSMLTESYDRPTVGEYGVAALMDSTTDWLRSRVGPDPADDSRLSVDPPDWVGYAAVSVGFVTLLYAAAIPGPKKKPRYERF
ncbi:MAG: hypothetical protein AAGJ97_03750 [Planctomycetota bacterium]